MFKTTASMARLRTFLGLFAAVFLIATTTPACSRKSGCPVNEEAKAKPNKKGEYSKKRGSSNLFPKHMRRGK